jgi:WD40 repeat protein
MLAVTVDDYQIDVVSLSTRERISTMENPSNRVLYDPKFSRDNSLIWTDNEDQTIIVWRTQDGQIIAEFENCLSFSLHPNSPIAALLKVDPNDEYHSRTLCIVSLVDGNVISEIEILQAEFKKIRYSPDGSALLVRRESVQNEFSVYDSSNLSLTSSTTIPSRMANFDYTADGDYIVATVLQERVMGCNVQVFRATDLAIVSTQSLGRGTSFGSILPEGNRYSFRDQKGYNVIDLDDNTQTHYDLPEDLDVIAIIDDGLGAIVSDKNQIFEYTFEDGTKTVIYDKALWAEISYPELTILM